MDNKFIFIGVMWILIVVAYIGMGFVMPAITSLTTEASASINASCNTSEVVGVTEAVASAPVWLWFLPGFIGILATVITLKSKR